MNMRSKTRALSLPVKFKCIPISLLSVYGFVLSGCSRNVPDEELRRIEDIVSRNATVGWGLALAIVGLTLLTIVAQLLSSRFHVSTFISYQHEFEHQAKHLRACLAENGIKSFLLEFAERDYDTTIEEVGNALKKSDIVIVIPGAAISFVDAEVLAAYVLRKPVLFLKFSERNTLPDTAAEGYPLFRAEKLESFKWLPLIRFCRYAANHWLDVPTNIQRALRAFWTLVLVFSVTVGVVFFLEHLIHPLIAYFSTELALWIGYGITNFTLLIWLGMVVVSLFLSILYKRIAARIAKQTIMTKRFTVEKLHRGLSDLEADKQIIVCLEREPQQRRGAPT